MMHEVRHTGAGGNEKDPPPSDTRSTGPAVDRENIYIGENLASLMDSEGTTMLSHHRLALILILIIMALTEGEDRRPELQE